MVGLDWRWCHRRHGMWKKYGKSSVRVGRKISSTVNRAFLCGTDQTTELMLTLSYYSYLSAGTHGFATLQSERKQSRVRCKEVCKRPPSRPSSLPRTVSPQGIKRDFPGPRVSALCSYDLHPSLKRADESGFRKEGTRHVKTALRGRDVGKQMHRSDDTNKDVP